MATRILKSIRNTINHWYLPLILGVLLIALAVYVFSTPLSSYLALAMIFSWSFLITGIIDILFAISNREKIEGWGWNLTVGILNLLFGIYLLANPGISLATLPFVVGFVIMFRSLQYAALSFELKDLGSRSWGWVLFGGSLGVLFSFLLIWNPLIAGLSLVYYTAISIFFAGIASSLLAFELKSLKSKGKRISEDWKQRYDILLDEYKNQVDNHK